jgi:hypothetical protein
MRVGLQHRLPDRGIVVRRGAVMRHFEHVPSCISAGIAAQYRIPTHVGLSTVFEVSSKQSTRRAELNPKSNGQSVRFGG